MLADRRVERGIRIGILVASLRGGGAERQAALWATICAQAGHDVAVLALWERDDEFDMPGSVQRRYAGKRGSLDFVRMTRAVRQLSRDSDIVVAFQPYCALLCLVARVAKPVVAVTGEDPRRFGDTSRVPRRALRAGLSAPVLRTAPTRGLIDCHRQLGISAGRRWLCVPNVADAAAFEAPSATREGVLFVGRLVPEKDPLLAVEAAQAAGVPLRILGEGPLRERVEAEARVRGADVELLGFSTDPWPVYASARVCLVTSHYEAFGNMLVESLAAGTPVVAGDCDFGPREVLAGAIHSHVVPRDRDALAAALREALDERAEEQVVRECLSIATRYTPEAIAPLVQDALELAWSVR